MNDVTDKLETLILMAMDANHEQTTFTGVKIRSKENVNALFDQGVLLNFDEMHPASAYTFDMVDEDRILTTTSDYLITHPSEIVGDESEVIVIDGENLKWIGYRKLRRVPKDVACFGRATHWYEMHFRLVTGNGSGCYSKRVIPIDKKGKPLLAKSQGHIVCNPNIDGRSLICCASVIEDAHRSNTMLAAVKDATEIKFPVPIDDYKDVFADRDGPMNGARRKAIVHWVARHLRRSNRGKIVNVKKHTRGIQEFTIDGLRVRLTPNNYHDIKSGVNVK